MIELIRQFYRSRVNELRAVNEAYDHISSVMSESSNIVSERPDEGGWSRTLRDLVKGNKPGAQASMIEQARYFGRFDPHGVAAIRTIVYYLIGRGIQITPQSKNKIIHSLWSDFWTSARNGIGGMDAKIAEIIKRTFRDGEILLQYFTNDANGKSTGLTTVRLKDPALLVSDPSKADDWVTSDGIEVNPDDVEQVISYTFRKGPRSTDTVKIEAEKIQHIKADADSDQKRGDSYLQPIMLAMNDYEQWIKYRIVLNKVRTSIVLIRKIIGGSADVAAIKGTLKQSSTARSGENKKQSFAPGTILNANQGVDYDFKSPNINATDAAEDGRNVKLQMAAGTQLPEYIFGDSSNSNYASTMISESPFVKAIHFWQKFFEFHIKEMFRRVVQNAVDAGKIKAPTKPDVFAADQLAEADSETAEDTYEQFFGCDVQWPEVVHREIDKLTNAILAQQAAGLISDPTAAAILGHDYDEEVRKQSLVEDEAENNPFKKNAVMDAQDAVAAAQRAGEKSIDAKDNGGENGDGEDGIDNGGSSPRGQ